MHVPILVAMAFASMVPPLTEGQRHQLATARDFGPLLDEGALYPLIKNAEHWSATKSNEAGALIPDHAAIRAAPADHRGQIFLIEGRLMRSRDPGPFARPGPWEGRWRQWVVHWGNSADDVAVVYLVDPPQAVPRRHHVRCPARFYKVWRDADQKGQTADYLVFVGKSARVEGIGQGYWGPTVTLGIMVVGLAIAFLLLRAKATRMGIDPRHHRSHLGQQPWNSDQNPQQPNELPDNPVEALRLLRCRVADAQIRPEGIDSTPKESGARRE